eukprot:COSAG01_NODE_4127_length_5326_cov_3.238569_4_plen_51_part_00
MVTTAAGKPGEAFSDVHVVMVHEVGRRPAHAPAADIDRNRNSRSDWDSPG